MPDKANIIDQFAEAHAKWKKAGKPSRTEAEMKVIYETHCDPCEHKIKKFGLTRCAKCGCCISSNRPFINKLLYATESCPVGKWKADAKILDDGTVLTGDELKEHRRMNRRERRKTRKKQQGRDAEKRREMLGWREKDNEDPLIVTDARGDKASLRDLWKGSAAFLVGGGPSINDIDYHRLAERGIVSLGINNVAGKVPVSMFTCSDPSKKFQHGIWLDPSMIKFVPRRRLRDHIRIKERDRFLSTPIRVKDCPNVWAYERSCALNPEEFLTEEKASWGRNNKGVKKWGGPKCIQTFFLGLRLMHYLGVRRCYLLGVDFRMDNPNGSVYSFSQSKHEGGQRANNGSYRNVIHFLKLIKPFLDASGMEIFNCNPESGLTLWPHVPFDTALTDCRSFVPQGEFDLQGWYEKKDFDEHYTEGQRG